MVRFLWLFVLFFQIIFCQRNLSKIKSYPPTPIEFRGLWCIQEWDNSQGIYARQVGQVFFYNNGTFTLTSMNNLKTTSVNRLVMINQSDNQETYQFFTESPTDFNIISCYWYRFIINGDIILSRYANGSCTSTFETDSSYTSIRYTRNALNCQYIDDEKIDQILSDTPFESELLQFDKSLRNSSEKSIVFYGSSSIRFWSTLEKDFSHLRSNVINRGFGGSTLKQCWQQFKRVILPLEPSLLIIYAGENDISEDQTPTAVQLIFHQLISSIRRVYPTLPVAFMSIKPSPSRFHQIIQMNITNHLIEEDIRNISNVDYINVFDDMLTSDGLPRSELFIADNLHMNEQGYAIWTRAVNNYLRMDGFSSKGFSKYEISLMIFVLNFLAFCFNYIQ